MFSSRKRTSKHYLTFSAVLVLLWQLIFPGTVWAGGLAQAVAGPTQKEPAVTLEKAISTVKDNFDIPQNYTKFSSGLNMDNQRQTWSLTWSPPDQQDGNFSAQVDVNTGEIMNMNNWKNNPQGPTVQIPSIQESEAQGIAVKLVTNLESSKLAELQLMPMDDTNIPLSNYGPQGYTVHWQRLVNGIAFPSDGISVQVNTLDGSILSYSMNWTPITLIPDAKGVISASNAEASFMKTQMFELQYFTSPPMRPLTTGGKQDVKLVYQLNNSYQGGAIDALTGEPIKVNYGNYYGYGKGQYGGMASTSSAAQADNRVVLTPAEQTEIDKSTQLISQAEAVTAVKRWLSIPDNLVLRGSNLSTDGLSENTRIWNLNWNGSGNKPEEQPQYMSARVDAATGELLGFDWPYPGPRTDKPVIDRKQSQTLAENFIQQIEPSHFKELKLSEDNNLMGKGYSDNGSQGFNYYRVVNGIPYRGNGINITVDSITKKIINYNLSWADLEFPAVDGILDGKQASTTLLKAEPLQLMYTQIFNPGQYDNTPEIRLVYQPMPASGSLISSNILDAKTGEFLDWQGQPASQMRRAYHFTDIGDNFAQKEITLLGQAGIFGEYQDSFHPDEQITVGSLLKAMLAVTNGNEIPGQTDDDIIKTAQQQGWLTEAIQPSATIDREDFTRLMIRYLKLESVAKLQDIYQATYSDVDKDFAGYAALAHGIGMFNLNGGTFESGHIMTRSEAAYALVKSLMFRH
ncbi:MAG: S-layer homology domain-containing protein [Desulfosporosinus sp.]|nr:S-layer homology domain-containing protein [Desulfosporosinus sp.]